MVAPREALLGTPLFAVRASNLASAAGECELYGLTEEEIKIVEGSAEEKR